MEITLDVWKKDCFGIGREFVVAVTPVLTEKELRQYWKDFRNLLIHDYQIEDIDEFTRWNFYLLYVVPDKNMIDRSLKYKIEHDTISSRKIIVNESDIKEGADNLIDLYIRYIIKPTEQMKKGFAMYDSNPELLKIYQSNEDK